MSELYAYKYALLDMSEEYYGQCIGVQDTTTYEVRPDYVPITDDSIDYLLKWYYPVPTSVTSFDDFNGLFYYNEEHTQPFEEGNAALI